ncbi:MAG: hypothetical protein A2X34_09260 [Elusimicrobia bacterium GWC2_51_8]|nr:MAG: hypothetical protein A2X33_01180 [Elusimicrobia bacterium GWA2_51_34]OGR60291.1 MAG: hypothetical protein A2X34_09260 [Elusimicrobia bacterium GWC2_51_8]OGR85887.1 MAG: hypothetical protein A2021_03345 [Elusimicrobia bacterium GWF2_52_66]HAF96140.1 hypothetical protein [Elusimicrobiota bacterium]HCE97750.1 hypothetical protein [Elusimicrobiota bacterium]
MPNKGKIGLFLTFALFAVAIVTACSPVFKAGHTNWDDQLYTYKNHSVQSLSAANFFDNCR